MFRSQKTIVMMAVLAVVPLLCASECNRFDNAGHTDDTPPPLSGELSLELEGCRKVLMGWPNITWPDPPEPDESGLRTYKIYKNGEAVTSTLGSSVFEFSLTRNFLFEDLEPGETAVLGVTAVDHAANESAPLEAKITMPHGSEVLCRDQTPPHAPNLFLDELDAIAASCKRRVTLRLTASDPVGDIHAPASGVAYYEVFRNGRYMTRTTTGRYEGTIGLTPGKTYSYNARAVDRAGNVGEMGQAVVRDTPFNCGRIFATPEVVHLLVLPVRPSDSDLPETPVNELHDFMRGGPTFPDHTVVDYFEELSYGRLQVEVFEGAPDWIVLPKPTEKAAGGYCSGLTTAGVGEDCDMLEVRNDALETIGLAADDFDGFLLLQSGMADNRAIPEQIAQVSVGSGPARAYRVAIHELSHMLSGHVNHTGGTWYCPGREAGTGFEHRTGSEPLDPLFGCNRLWPIRDEYSVLGTSDNTYHIPMALKWLKGLLLPRETAFAPLGEAEFELQAAETAGIGNVVRHVVVPGIGCTGGDEESPLFSVEYRTKNGFDGDPHGFITLTDFPVEGIQIRLMPWKNASSGGGESFLLGTIEEINGTFAYETKFGTSEIELLSMDGLAARIRVKRCD